jgi:hypothetical protein
LMTPLNGSVTSNPAFSVLGSAGCGYGLRLSRANQSSIIRIR